MTDRGRLTTRLRARTAACLVLVAAAVAGAVLSGCRKPEKPAATEPVPTGEPAALALWKRSLEAYQIPIRARVAVTTWTKPDKPEKTTVDLTQGTGGRYRLVYRSPKAVAGRVVVSDGKTTWQSAPGAKQTKEIKPEQVRVPLAEPKEKGYRWEIEPRVVPVAGLAAQVLAARDADGKLRQRRWVDRKTGRTLRVDEYENGRLTARAAAVSIAFLSASSPTDFAPVGVTRR